MGKELTHKGQQRQRSLWTAAMLCLLALWLLPQQASATYVDEYYNYSVNLNGTNTIKIQVPCYDQEGADCWVTDGKLYASWEETENGKTTTKKKIAFRWERRRGSTDSSSKDIYIDFSTEVDGSFDVTQGNSDNHFTMTKDDGDLSRLIYRNSDGNTYTVYAVWRLPYDLLGKTLKFSWEVERDGTARSNEKVKGLNDKEISVPKAENTIYPQVTTATLAYSEKGKIEIPWFMASNNITKLEYVYNDSEGKEHRTPLATNANNGTILLDATVPHNQFYIMADYKDNSGYEVKNVSSTSENLKMIHIPVGLTASPTGDKKAAVLLRWNIEHPKTEDLIDIDFFEIERSLTGLEADYQSIGAVGFRLDSLTYSFRDSTLVDAIADGMLKNNGTLENVTYRVRRTATATWGWGKNPADAGTENADVNPAVAYASCIVDDLHLLRLKTYSAAWEDEKAYTVRVKWEYANEYNGVWDDRAQMILRVVLKNRKDVPVDTTEYVLTRNDLDLGYKVISLERPCINYDIQIITDRGNSPLHEWSDVTQYFFPIKSASDWNTFCSKVSAAKGTTAVNARLYADISTTNGVGVANFPYCGVFDGNGHTITVNFNGSTQYQVLFRAVKNATIRNLHTKGTSNSSAKFSAGIIGQVISKGYVLVENCRSSVTVNSTVNGDATNGGLVALMRSTSKLTLRNCQFDGSLTGNNCHSNGGIIGFMETNCNATIESCLFDPVELSTKYDNCATWARVGNSTDTLTVRNSYYTKEYFKPEEHIYNNGRLVIRNASDWEYFRTLVTNAKGNSDVNAVMDADITVTSMIGDPFESSYRGTFDGNGHTLNVNISAGNTEFAAPFRYAKTCTIKNLRVTGTVNGGQHAAGLIGGTVTGTDRQTITNCRVSATINSSNEHDGGFIGHGTTFNHTITDCLFDGTLTAVNNSYAGAIIGWEEGGTDNIITNCLEHGSYPNIKNKALNWTRTTAYGNRGANKNNWSYNNLFECENVGSMSVANLVSKLGSGWKNDGGTAVPVMSNTGIIATFEAPTAELLLSYLGENNWQYENAATKNKVILKLTSFSDPNVSYPTPTLPNFYHESNGKIDKTLVTQTRQSSVVLVWETDNNPVDFFTVLRRIKGTENWEQIATDLTQTSYEDATVSPLVDYIYKVRATNDCEGVTYTETDEAEGACKHSGKLDGYIRFADGTAVPGIQVLIVTNAGKGASVKVTTDDSGYFVAEDLSYMGEPSVTYDVTPVATSNVDYEVTSYPVTFDGNTNYRQVHEFIINNSHRFTGYVMYDGTSIPVKGAHFLVNGHPLYNAKGELVETDFEGMAEFRLLDGRNTIQVVMDNHTFTDDGYYKSRDGYVFHDDVARAYFYDATTVKLTGRVVGGKDQGSLPLDHNLSKNNLGDNLTMVLTLEGDNTSWLVFDNTNPTLSTRHLTFKHPGGGGHQTTAEVQRKRMIVKPDSITGEYVLMLPPVRWKVTQVYCQGYPTLFQDGQVNEVIDLTEKLIADTLTTDSIYYDVDGTRVVNPAVTYNAIYNRIYHSPVEISYKQIGYDKFDYFGDRTYQAQTLGGTKVDVPLAYEATDGHVNPFNISTHRPTLTGTEASSASTGKNGSFEMLFDGDINTKWCTTGVSTTPKWWVNFKTDHAVSVKQYILTTAEDTKQYGGRNPKTWRLKGKAKESDTEWVTIAEVKNDTVMQAANLTPFTFDAQDHGFYQYFRFEIDANGSTNWMQLSELALVCRGQADSNPAEDYNAELIGGVAYTFGYPVFSLERRYPIQISVGERYVYNNSSTGNVDIVKVGGGKVTIHNGLQNNAVSRTYDLDENGEYRWYLQADAVTRLLTGENALRTVTMTLEQDGTTYEATPLRGYILNMFPLASSKDMMATGQPQLVDILRDPPGGASSATLSKGSKLKMSYTVDMKFSMGANLSFGTGTTLNNYSGIVAGGADYGLINNAKNFELIDLDIVANGAGKKAYSYTMNVGEDITTSSSATMVGADADLYIGITQNLTVTPMSTIRAIPDSIYQHMLGRTGGNTLPTGNTVKYGSLLEIAKGTDSNGNLYHLVRDESLSYGPKVESQFIHSQKHIVTELIPKLAEEILSLMFTGTKAEAQAQADQTKKVVYLSNVDAKHEDFGIDYTPIAPTGVTDYTDEVKEKYRTMMAWVEMIAMNEREKLNAYDKVANYDIDGGSKVTYNETFETEYSLSEYINYPFTTADYYGDDGNNDRDRAYASLNILLSQPAVSTALKLLIDKIGKKTGASGGVSTEGTKSGNMHANQLELTFAGTAFKFGLEPVFEYSSSGSYGTAHNFTRKESFTISMDNKSHLNFDVYRVKTEVASDVKTEYEGNFNVFTNTNFDSYADNIINHLRDGVNMNDAIYPRSFVYRTRSGATANPWEDARYTQAYRQGTLLDERTKKISNPKITLDRQSVSGVAITDPARFKVYLTNESEQPEAATGGLTMFTFFSDGASNPNGAKIFVDGAPLTGSGTTVVLNPGKVLEKTMEVYAGDEFDYTGLKVGVASQSDFANTQNYVEFDVHYLRQAGAVNIATPSDKWVMNCDAEYNAKRGWFLPIIIDGFDKYQHNFDHIEFQYKESQRGEDSWTNICSFYADSLLMAEASGEHEMIPENGNIQTQFYGEGPVTEKAYDLRAVLYCRDGNSFLTTSSKVMSGVKDTRRPQLFGTPEPTNGILTDGDNIIFNFSEDIEYNYLDSKTNFEVKGEVNNQNVSEAVSIQFSGNGSVESEAQRNFSGKNVTIDLKIKPSKTGRDMPLFSHGTNSKKLQLWLTKDYKLKAVVDDQTFTSDSIIDTGLFQQVAMAISQPVDATNGGKLTLFKGGVPVGDYTLNTPYSGTGALIFGRTNETDRAKSTYYEGRMMEARVWYRALTGDLVGTTYGYKRLTGYEMGLVDYYPMNEGTGEYALDKTQGANAKLINVGWAMPRGLSLHVDWEDHGLKLTDNALNRTAEQDYTLMFWFKTDATGRGTLLSNGAGRKQDIGAENQFNITFEAEKLRYRSNGMLVELGNSYSDNQWHHYAMTVNRARNIVNIYLDQALKATFAADSLGGISGGHPLIGAALYDELQADGKTVTVDTRNWLRGNIDELMMFQQALPLTLIQSYATKSPYGDEAGLLTYLSFDRQERQKDNDIVLVPYPYSKKLYLDDKGNVRYELDPVTKENTSVLVHDNVFVDSVSVILAHIDDTQAAPVVPYEELKNLNFSFVGKDNQLLVNIDELNARINRRNIYVTVRDVEDKNGNAMASPATACFYVTNSSLQWIQNRIEQTVPYGSEAEEDIVYLMIQNDGATSHKYTIENCPKWLTLDKYSDILGPQDYAVIHGTVNKNLNVGSYDEIIYLTDEDGVSEPLYLNLTVEGPQPEWTWYVESEYLQHSMNIAGRVYVNNEIDIDNRDIVGAFDSNNVCHGFAHIEYSALTGESNLYLTVYDNQTSGRDLYFKLWQYSTGRELVLSTSPEIKFENAAVLGTDKPVRFDAGDLYVQTFDLTKGWNWVSFNVSSEKLFNLNNLLDGLPWKDGDVLTDMSSDMTLVYRNGHWLSSTNTSNVVLSPRKAYAIKVQQDISFPVAGVIIKQKDSRTISLKQGWNGIGYTPMLNLTVETALSDYYDKAEAGDVIKSHDEFAYFTISNGVGRWRGSLQYMKPGEGYMLLRKGATATSFVYPYYDPSSTFIDEWSYATVVNAAPPKRNTMSVSAIVEGVDVEDGDRLVAFADGEMVGKTHPQPLPVSEGSGYSQDEDATTEHAPLFYLTIAAENEQGIWFAIERDGELIAATNEQMKFRANDVIGSPDTPTAIRFTRSGNEDGKWYTTSGILLGKRPTLPGVYIYNGKKIVIK